MPHASIKFTAGVTQNETPTLNETGIATTQLVRLKPDPQGLVLLEKLGGWARYWASALSGVIKALWAWEDTNADQWLAAGCENSPTLGYATLNVFNSVEVTSGGNPTGILQATQTLDITPNYAATAVPVNVTYTVGNSTIIITDPLVQTYSTGGPKSGDFVYIITPTFIGGVIILSGLYYITAISATTYSVDAVDLLGNPALPIYSNLTVSTVLTATRNAGTGIMTIEWNPPASSYAVWDIVFIDGMVPSNWNGYFAVLTSGLDGGTGDYFITVYAPNATGTVGTPGAATITNNGFTPNFSVAAAGSNDFSVVTVTLPNHGLSPGSTFTVSLVTIVGGVPIVGNYIVQRILDFSQFTINIPPTNATQDLFENGFVVTGGNSTGTSITLNFNDTAPFKTSFTPAIGDVVNVNGIKPTGWDGIYTLTGATSTSITYARVAPAGPWTSGGYFSDTKIPPYMFMIYILNGSTHRIKADSWTLGNWGEQLIACPNGFYPIGSPAPNADFFTQVAVRGVQFQPLFYWTPRSFATNASVIPNCPPVSLGAFVAMPQRQIIAYGTSFSSTIDPLLLRWCDVGNYTVWIGTVTNQAGQFRLTTGSAIIGGLQAGQQSLIWTDIGLWVMQYIGLPYVYSINQIGFGCGLIAQKAAGTLNGVTFWMSQSQFFTLTSGGVQPLVCPIWDVIFQDIDKAFVENVIIAINENFQEVAWYYPQASNAGTPLAGFPTAYIKFNAMLGAANSMIAWDFGTLDRSAWIGQSVLGPPIGASSGNLIYQHEISPDADGAALAWSFTTGYFALSEGDFKTFVDQFWVDMKWGLYGGSQGATVNLTFSGVDYSGDTPYAYGPYPLTVASTFITPRIRTRLLSMTFSGDDLGSFARIGNCRYRWQSDGRF